MTAITTETKSRTGSRKIAAVLGGGLVLGVGAVATLAAWNDTDSVTSTATGAATDYQYTLVTTAAAGCGASALSTGTVIGTSDLSIPTGTFSLNKRGASTSPGTPTFLCFEVTADSSAAQASMSTITWKLQAVSN